MSKISVLLTEPQDERFCAYCEETGHKKSTLIAHLIKEHLDREGYEATNAKSQSKPDGTNHLRDRNSLNSNYKSRGKR